jgi:hypothetical protein
MNMNFKGPRYAYPSIEVVLELADQPERLLEHQERSPRYKPAPAVFYVPGLGGSLSPVIQVSVPHNRVPFLLIKMEAVYQPRSTQSTKD